SSFNQLQQPSLSRDSESRPLSVHSTSNLSTHSNDPLTQKRPAQKKPFKTGASFRKNNMSKRDDSEGDDDDDRRKPKKQSPYGQRNGSGAENKDGADPQKKKKKNIGKRFVAKVKRLEYRGFDPAAFKMVKMGRNTQFSNERLYMHWLRLGVFESVIAVTLLSFANGPATYIGVALLVLSQLTLVYGTTLYHKRHLYLSTKRKDVAYFVKVFPTFLVLCLMVLYTMNFA
ncbi:hypothetical protein BGW38_008959, partial [Lunasporangiospora selenospora]